MLAEGKKKKAAPADDMDFDMSSVDGGGEAEGDLDAPAPAPKKSKGKTDKPSKKASKDVSMDDVPADDAPVVDKGAVMGWLKDATPKDRKSVCTKLQAMVKADEEAAEPVAESFRFGRRR
jgi:hypothetical protein